MNTIIEACIRDGSVEEAHSGCVSFVGDVAGTEWHLIASPTTGDVLTAFAPAWHDPEWADVAATGEEVPA